MGQIIVRNLPEALKARLKRRAARHGRSMEEEARDILRDALKEEPAREGLGTAIARQFAGRGLGLDFEIAELKGQKVRPAKFDR